MRIIKASVQNFGSYKSLDFDFNDQGLCLIQGATGSGKSTLCDVIPWVLFGVTAKDGAADEIKSWNSEEGTFGYVKLENITVYRSRSPNDLYYTALSSLHEVKHRGKDLKDTQKHINELLGMTAETYLAGAYFHEFSKTASFFITTAKNRRLICEQIVDLSLNNKLNERIALEAKANKPKHDQDLQLLRKIEADANNTGDTITYLFDREANYTAETEKALNDFESQWDLYVSSLEKHVIAEEAAEIELNEASATLNKSGKCKHCNAPNQVILDKYNKAKHKLAMLQSKKFDLDYDKERLKITGKSNSYAEDIEKYSEKYKKLQIHIESLSAKVALNVQDALDLEMLKDLNEVSRSRSIASTISFIQDKTNEYLSEYFDAEIKVDFDSASNDKLDTIIYKDGNVCSYTQLSKGQRQLLKLTFGIAVMQAVANKSGVQFSEVFFDEATSGLDDNLKVKAFRMFEYLATQYDSVFIVDHADSIKSLFPNKYNVELINGCSQIEVD